MFLINASWSLVMFVMNVRCRFASAKSTVGTAANENEDDDDFELFGSDDEEADEAAEKLKQERLAAYEAKKATSQ